MEGAAIRTRAGYYFDKQATMFAVDNKKYIVFDTSEAKEVYKCPCCGKRTSSTDPSAGEFFAVNNNKEIKAIIGGRAERYIFIIDGNVNDDYKLVKVGDSCWKKLFQGDKLPQFSDKESCSIMRSEYWKKNGY